MYADSGDTPADAAVASCSLVLCELLPSFHIEMIYTAAVGHVAGRCRTLSSPV